MAHKHNRRRHRARPRQTRTDDFDALSDFPFSSTPSEGSSQRSLKPPNQTIVSSSINAKHWHNRYLAWQKREIAQRQEAAQIEAEQLKLFGGEPGDDTGLCHRMLEAFEGMEWVNT